MQQPSICRMVIYRDRDDADMPAVITAVLNDAGDVHLTPFPPPTVAPPILSHEWGVAYSEQPRAGHWRWPRQVG